MRSLQMIASPEKKQLAVDDGIARQQAIDTRQSFIVQAPAGSGKTELLVQRYLALLAKVNNPEEILAITFTRKAAAEMQARILKAFSDAEANSATKSPHAQLTRQLAQEALQQDKLQSWSIIANPNRLRIQTIDALCSWLNQQMPLLSDAHRYGNVAEKCEHYYRQAVQNFLEHLESTESWQEPIANLLLHLDNRYDVAESLLVGMLKRRTQWSHYLLGNQNTSQLREILQRGLENIALQAIAECNHSLPTGLAAELISLVTFAAANGSSLPGSFSSSLHGLDAAEAWKQIAYLLLTNDNQWRKKIDARNGFPASARDMKSRVKNLLTALADNERLRLALTEIKLIPPIAYSPQQWQLIEGLLKILPVLIAELKLVFNQHDTCDFTEILLNAEYALGKLEEPSELALYLDYKIKHILIDEFQDTSISQYRLLQLITAGWSINDEHTLFLVGDPMQSIYRFRNAEVGLFLKLKSEGISNIKLTPLTLYQNFRSTPAIIAWINEQFSHIFPLYGNPATGAITYSPSVSHVKETTTVSNMAADLQLLNIGATEWQVSQLLQKLRTDCPHDSIAILVRSRTHLTKIIPLLRQRQIAYQGTEIELLHQRPIIQDLLALTRALLHPADRIAWLAILRAPWCGLTLEQLHAFFASSEKNLILDQLMNLAANNVWVSKNLQRFTQVITAGIQQRQRKKLSEWIKGIWLSIGGPACYAAAELIHSQAYFNLLAEYNYQSIYNFSNFTRNIIELYAESPVSQAASVQVMTIHKAKGLEFDHVIIPHLERKPMYDPHQLFLLSERSNPQISADLILAPIKAKEENSSDAIYDYLRHYDNIKADYEAARLFYVAVTRASKSLHLFAEIDGAAEFTPAKGSFLAMLGAQFSANELIAGTTDSPSSAEPASPPAEYYLSRLADSWELPVEYQVKKELEQRSREINGKIK